MKMILYFDKTFFLQVCSVFPINTIGKQLQITSNHWEITTYMYKKLNLILFINSCT